MNAGTLDLLHDAGHEVIRAVADGVDLALGTQDVLVHQDRVAHVNVLRDDAHVLDNVAGIVATIIFWPPRT